MAKRKGEASGTVRVRVLTDCWLGRCDDVVELPASDAAVAVEAGVADDHPDAVAHAETLKA